MEDKEYKEENGTYIVIEFNEQTQETEEGRSGRIEMADNAKDEEWKTE